MYTMYEQIKKVVFLWLIFRVTKDITFGIYKEKIDLIFLKKSKSIFILFLKVDIILSDIIFVEIFYNFISVREHLLICVT